MIICMGISKHTFKLVAQCVFWFSEQKQIVINILIISGGKNSKMFEYELKSRHQTPQSRPNPKTSVFSISQNLQNRIGNLHTGISNRMKLAVIHKKPQTVSISQNWKQISGGYTKIVPAQTNDDIQMEDEDVLLGEYLTNPTNKPNNKQWSNLSSARHKISNAQLKDRFLRNKYVTSQKQANNNECDQLDEFNNRKPVKISGNFYSPHKPSFNSVSITQLDKLSSAEQIQQLAQERKQAHVAFKIKEKTTNTSSNFVIKQKHEPYFRRKRPSQSKNVSIINIDTHYTTSAFDRLQGQNQTPIQKDGQTVENDQISQPQSKLQYALQKDFYFAQSFKGRRPYNEDRYICETKSSLNIRQRLQHIHNRVNGSPNKCELKQDSCDVNKESINKYWLFGVFDGHGGSRCSQYLKENFNSALSLSKNFIIDPQLAIRETFMKMEEKFISICDKSASLETSGSCAVICLIRNGKIYIGNVGDSRALLLGPSTFKQITKDHKPDDKEQKMRIIRFGGKLYKDGSVLGAIGKQNIRVFNQTRIMPGSLNVSRTLGDIEVKMKKYGGLPGIVIAEPEIFVENLDQPQYDHILLASDGLFEGLTNQQIHNIYKNRLTSFSAGIKTENDSFAKTFVKQIIHKSGQKSSDNITVIFVKVPQRRNKF